MFKKILSLSFVFILSCFIVSTSFVKADSISTLPPKDTGLEKYYYKLYAPKTQTTYKKFSRLTQKVGNIRKDGSRLQAIGGNIITGGGILAPVATSKNVYLKVLGKSVVKYAGPVGGVIYFAGLPGSTAYSKFKKDAIVVTDIYFKWTNVKRFEYKVKMITYIKYKGKRVSEKKTRYFSKTL